MNNKEYAYNIVSKIQADKFNIGKLFTASVFYDHNEPTSSLLYWKNDYHNDISEIVKTNNVNAIVIKSNTGRMYSNAIFASNFKTTNFQVEFELSIPTIKANNIYFTFYINNNQRITFEIQPNALLISCNNKSIKAGFKFKSDIKYNLLVTKENNLYSFMVDGIYIGYIDSSEFTDNINVTGQNAVGIIANNHIYENSALSFMGNIYNINISNGEYLKYYTQYSKYSANLISHLNINSLSIENNANTIVTNIEAIHDSKIWEYNELTLNNYYITNTSFSANINTNFTLSFIMNNNNKNLESIELININDIYKVIYTSVYIEPEAVGIPDPDVIINEYTTSALNFENNIIDQVGTTVWNKEGTATVQSVNKIFGNNSFETKALGDSLYTSSNIITGGSTPFTIEFYVLIKGGNNMSVIPLFTKNKNQASGDQGYYLNMVTGRFFNIHYSSWGNTEYGYEKIKFNEINKITYTYDGVALRNFVNDKLNYVYAKNNIFDVSSALPFTFLDNYIPLYSSNRVSTIGLIDNINIHDGIATKVRDHDPYEEYLVVDLAFDGENNSTKIVDNGTAKSTWSVSGNAKLSMDQKFDGFSSLYLDGVLSYIHIMSLYDNKAFNFSGDFTITFNMNTNVNTRRQVILDKYNSGDALYQISVNTDGSMYFTYYKGSSYKFFISNKTGLNNGTNHKIQYTKSGNFLNLYINDLLDSTNDVTGILFEQSASTSYVVAIGSQVNNSNPNYDFNGYIKNLKIYNGVAVIPEDPTGKIQLNFNDDLVDKYGNSVWTNNSVSFDQSNSVKGYAGYFATGSSRITCGVNDNFNFENKDFLISCDIKRTISSASSNILTSGATSYPTNWVEIFCRDSIIGYNNQLDGYGFDIPLGLPLNNYYSFDLIHKNTATHIKVNDVIIGTEPSKFITNNFNANNNTVIGGSLNTGSQFGGYIDNFKSIKDYKEDIVIDKPAVHLPLETNAINTGFANLIINSIGEPTYTTIDDKKCIKFESGKYLSINSNNIFNLGTNSDFYIEFDFYINTHKNYNFLLCNDNVYTNQLLTMIFLNNLGELKLRLFNDNDIYTSNVLSLNKFHNFKLYRKNSITFISLNDEISQIISFNYNMNINNLIIGSSGWNTASDYCNGYMANFKMFVGTSEIPETYNDKKVLDLDFKPTKKSYLFKDNNNKCLIHPVNITQRDYQNSKYCCTFNGTDQYIQLGKNELFNFGNDDFVIEIIFCANALTGWNMLLSDNSSSTNFIDIESSGYIAIKIGGTRYDTPVGSIQPGIIYKLQIQVFNNILKVFVNNIQLTLDNLMERSVSNANFNLSDNTFIGTYGVSKTSELFNGTIYSIKVLRNTNDLKLLDKNSAAVTEPIINNTKYILTNGIDEHELYYENITKDTNIQLINDDDIVTLKINDDTLTVNKTDNIIGNNVKLFDGFTGDIKDHIKLYNKAIYEDDYVISDFIDTVYPPIEIENNDIEFSEVNIGTYNISGYIEGNPSAKYNMVNKQSGLTVNSGIGTYNYGSVDYNYIDEYEIQELYNNKIIKRYDIHDQGPPGFLTALISSKVCSSSDFAIRLYRRDSGALIGEYELDKTDDPYKCTIHNLDTTKSYDIMLFDKNTKVESRTMSDRKPELY